MRGRTARFRQKEARPMVRLALASLAVPALARTDQSSAVTFTKDASIQKNCQSCHQPRQ